MVDLLPDLFQPEIACGKLLFQIRLLNMGLLLLGRVVLGVLGEIPVGARVGDLPHTALSRREREQKPRGRLRLRPDDALDDDLGKLEARADLAARVLAPAVHRREDLLVEDQALDLADDLGARQPALADVQGDLPRQAEARSGGPVEGLGGLQMLHLQGSQFTMAGNQMTKLALHIRARGVEPGYCH
jgi:hypothetical protein